MEYTNSYYKNSEHIEYQFQSLFSIPVKYLRFLLKADNVFLHIF